MNTPNDTTTPEVWVPLGHIAVPADVRVHTQEDIDSRAVSMAREGQAQPILLSKEGDQLVLVYGNGRLESAKKLGWEKIRADVREGLTESQKLMLTLAENDEREDASPFYTAGLYQRIMAAEAITKNADLAAKLKKDAGDVSRILALAELAPEVQEKLERSNFSMGHLREILRLQTSQQQLQLAQECMEKDYSVRELQGRVKRLLNPGKSETGGPKAEGPGFHFSWRGNELTVKGSWDAAHGPVTMSEELNDALVQFVGRHPRPEREVAKAA